MKDQRGPCLEPQGYRQGAPVHLELLNPPWTRCPTFHPSLPSAHRRSPDGPKDDKKSGKVHGVSTEFLHIS